MKTAHLFAGAGGGLYADLILGHTPVLAIEIERFCCDVLEQRKSEGWFPGLHIDCGDVREFDFGPWAGKVDCLSAGFPCQDVSCASNTKTGIHGERSGLVSEVFRAAKIIRPGLIFLENSPEIKTRGRQHIIRQLVSLGYTWRDGTLAASDVGAPHKRNRWWLLAANADGMRQLEQKKNRYKKRERIGDRVEASADTDSQRIIRIENASARNNDNRDNSGWVKETGWTLQRFEIDSDTDNQRRVRWAGWSQRGRDEPANDVKIAADPMRDRLEKSLQPGGLSETEHHQIQTVARYTGAYDWNPVDCNTIGMADGLSRRKHRIKALGNAQVPLQAALAFCLLSGCNPTFSN